MKIPTVLLALAAAACAASTTMPTSDPPAALAAAESAFAAHSVREDMRVAFMANFADDGVFVRNGWVAANAYLAKQTAPPIVLDWRPVYTEVARSGELGLSTGPWKLVSKEKPDAPPAYGQFVSIWRRSGGGPWRVEVDLGIAHPQSALWDARLVSVTVADRGGPPGESLALAEQRFAAETKAGARAAYARFAAEDVRFYRTGTAPTIGKAAALASGTMSNDAVVWSLDRLETARSGDFGYARGSYAAAADSAKPLGWFLRVWRVEAGEWRVILDVTNPAPPRT
jgi:ketosteroid isomerase-like protein